MAPKAPRYIIGLAKQGAVKSGAYGGFVFGITKYAFIRSILEIVCHVEVDLDRCSSGDLEHLEYGNEIELVLSSRWVRLIGD